MSRRVAPLAWLLLPLAACGSPGSGPFDAGGDAPIDSGSAASDALLVDASSPAGRTVLWSSDFSTGDFSQWNVQDTAHGGAVSVGSDSVASIVAAPAGFPGTYAAQLAAYGDSTGQAHIPPKVRVQLNSTRTQTAANEGESYWYEWWNEFPSSPSLNDGPWLSWHLVQQFGTGQAFNTPHLNVQDYGNGPIIQLETYTGTAAAPHGDIHAPLAPLSYDVPYHFEMFVKWSKSKLNGLVEVLVNGAVVVPLQPAQTMPSDGIQQTFQFDIYRLQNNGGFNTTVVTSGVTRYTIP